MNFSSGKNIGFIAQDVKKVVPEVVSQDDKGYHSVAYSNIVPLLVEAIKEQQKIIEKQKKKLVENRGQLNTVQTKLAKLEASFRRIEMLVARQEEMALIQKTANTNH